MNNRERYKLQEEIGQGSFSTVYKAFDSRTNMAYAAKIIPFDRIDESDSKAMDDEVRILASLSHPHILKLHEAFRTDLELWLILDLADGGDVYDRIAQKAYYTELEARNMARILLETIDYMHSVGIVHRDLKPENLLLVSNMNDVTIKIGDFGFAKYVRELQFPGEVVCGTPNFVSPEVLRSRPYKTEPDIWALGVIFYILLAGYPPFYDKSQGGIFRKIKVGKYVFHPDFWSDISHDAKDFITKMLCVELDKRWNAKQLLEHPWIQMNENMFSSRNLIMSQEVLRQMRVKRGVQGIPALSTENTILINTLETDPGNMPTKRFEKKSKRRSSVMITCFDGNKNKTIHSPTKEERPAYFQIDPSLVYGNTVCFYDYEVNSAETSQFTSSIAQIPPHDKFLLSDHCSPLSKMQLERNILRMKQDSVRQSQRIIKHATIVEETKDETDYGETAISRPETTT